MRAQEFTAGDDKPEFRGPYPSIQTTLGEDKYPGVVDYKPNQEKKLHQNLDIAKGVDIGTFDRFDADKKKWHDLAFVQDYSEGSFDLNNYLHRHYRNKTKPKDIKQHLLHIQAMDRALAKHKLKEKIVVYTGLIESPANAWKIHGADITKPIRLHLPAYTSTTTNLRIAVNHADDHDINSGRDLPHVPADRHKPRNKDAPKDEFGTQILMLVLPAGSPAASIKNVSEWEAENEILLPRGANIEIDPRPTVTRNRVYIWHARVLGYSPVLVSTPAGKKSVRKGQNIQEDKRDGIDLNSNFIPATDDTDEKFLVTASAGGKQLGRAYFINNDGDWEASDVAVDERFRGQGIAALMYNYAKEHLGSFSRSPDQTDAGEAFWDKHRPDQTMWEQGVAENFADGKKPGRKGLAKRVGVNCKQPISKLRSIASHSSGEKQRMAHWCANMKSGKNK